MALTGMAIAAAVGLAKSQLVDKPKADAERALAAKTAAYAPWTGMKPGEVTNANPFADMMQYGMTGAQIGGKISAANAASAAGNTPNNPWSGGAKDATTTGALSNTPGGDVNFKGPNPFSGPGAAMGKKVAMTDYPPGYTDQANNQPWLPPTYGTWNPYT